MLSRNMAMKTIARSIFFILASSLNQAREPKPQHTFVSYPYIHAVTNLIMLKQIEI